MIQIHLDKKNNLPGKVPACPGVYLFVNESKDIIYVGKSKNLRRRLSQYVHAKRLKKHVKMRKILAESRQVWIETCETALRAELLETRLIQKLRPKWNIAGAFHFLYPMIGITLDEERVYFCYTTQPESFPNFQFHGAFRSRFITREAFFSLIELLRLVAHQVKEKKKLTQKYSHIYQFRRIESQWALEFERFLKGESKKALEDLSLALLENKQARTQAHQVQDHLKNLLRFWRWETKPLQSARELTRTKAYPVSQADRDILFLQYRSLLKEREQADPRPSAK